MRQTDAQSETNLIKVDPGLDVGEARGVAWRGVAGRGLARRSERVA